jgi:hypothetical protein
MFSVMLKINPTAKSPNFENWSDDIRLMREIDLRDHKTICELFQFAKHDSFWSPNIQSPSKLREKWDQLTELRARGPGKSDKPKDPAFFGLADIDHSAGVAAMEANMRLRGTTYQDGDDLSFDLPEKQNAANQ